MKNFYIPKIDKTKLENIEISKDKTLPNALIIGDSISIGYTPYVIKLLKDKVNVSHVNENCGDTDNGVKNIERWLGKTKWDIIHFNFGLHDFCYRHPESELYGNRDKIKGKIGVSLKNYKINLESIIKRLKETNAELIWATTTLVPKNEAGRFAGDEIKYNAAAQQIVEKYDITIDDLYSITKKIDKSMFLLPGDVHFKKAAYQILARQVSDIIIKKLI